MRIISLKKFLMEVVIIGAGSLATQVIEVFILNNFTIIGLLDDNRQEPLFGYPILGKINDWTNTNYPLFCAIGDIQIRKQILEKFLNYRWINCIHPQANISSFSQIGNGNYIGPGCCLMPRVSLGNNNILDPGSILSHDVKVRDNNHIASHCCLLGRVKIGNNNLLGANSTVLPDISIGNDNILGAGAVATKFITEGKILKGIPAREKNS
jgi:sugar O-acyltransferase (sialic acid O-acetyltransferase NeuD family)